MCHDVRLAEAFSLWYDAGMKRRAQKQTGFTIVELLIVIVVIAILATVTVVAFNGTQQRARLSKIDSDMRSLNQAITMARINQGELRYDM